MFLCLLITLALQLTQHNHVYFQYQNKRLITQTILITKNQIKSINSFVLSYDHTMTQIKKTGISLFRELDSPSFATLVYPLHTRKRCTKLCLKIIFSRITGLISTKLGTKHPWVKRIQVYSNEGPLPFSRGDNKEIAKIH